MALPIWMADNKPDKEIPMGCTIYALKVKGMEQDVSHSLQQGEGRFGWSYIENADLHHLKDKAEKNGWCSLSAEEKDCYQGFLLDIKPDDYVVYINVPEWGQCTLARVTEPYFWKKGDTDFNHRFHVEPDSVRVFDRNDAIVSRRLSAKLKLQGRWWRLYDRDLFSQLQKDLDAGKAGQPSTLNTRLGQLRQELDPVLGEITRLVQKHNPNVDLEELIARVFQAVPDVCDVQRQRGRADNGADILVTFESGLPVTGLGGQQTCIVQIKSFEGEHGSKDAIKQIEQAFEYYQALNPAMGLIISTADRATPEFEQELDAASDRLKKPIGLLMGADVAAFILKHGAGILGL